MEKPSVLGSTYIKKEAPKNALTHQSIYEVPSEMKISELIQQINLAGLALNKLAIERFAFRLKGKGGVDNVTTLGQLSREHGHSGILYLEYDAEALFEYSSITSILKQ